MSNFDDIRPYVDEEVPSVLEKLIHNDEFLDIILKNELPKLNNIAPKIAKATAKTKLKKKLKDIHSIDDFQNEIGVFFERLMERTETKISHTGLNDASNDYAHLFMSNHRDIAMDPGFIGYLLHGSKHGTIEIAIGDNLLKKDFASDLMRLNKSFIVKRSVKGREKLFALKQLSEYIHHAVENNRNVWIAQREGRAKNSIDKTDPTILKMFHIAKKNDSTLMEAINALHIIPVSISYEYDPCAELKALELHAIDTLGKFEKDEETDLKSIAQGINGFKGNVHLCFGEEVIAESDDPEVIARQIDAQIVSNYKLHASNYIAYNILRETNKELPEIEHYETTVTDVKKSEFIEKYNAVADELKPYFLNIYANPVIHKSEFK